MVLSFNRNVQSETFGTGGERAGDKGQHRHLARWLWESSWVTGLAPHRKAEHRAVKPLMQKQFCQRERGKSAPVHADHQTGHWWVLSHCPLTLHRFVKVWDCSRLLWSTGLSQEPGMCLCCHGIQLQRANLNPRARNDEFGTLTLHRNLSMDSHGKTNVQRLEGLRVSPLPLVSITSSKMLLLSTQFLVTRRIVYSVPGSRASLGWTFGVGFTASEILPLPLPTECTQPRHRG